MTIVFVLWALSVGLELALFLPLVRRGRAGVAGCALALNGFAGAATLVWRLDLWSILLFALSLYRALNDMRIVQARMHEQYLRRATRRTTLTLLIWQVAVAALWIGWQWRRPSMTSVWLGLSVMQTGAALGMLGATLHHMKHTAWPASLKHLSDEELPAISVAIPARNETVDLEECLQTIIASDYPKLEILVLDDRSQTRRTPEIIRSFAHDGVRFLQGEPPADTWLPKNSAYDHLAREASGEIIVFCGADVRFGVDALTQLITFMRQRRKAMVSILPERERHIAAPFALAQAMRYWWELAPPRRWLNRPPVLSSCWAIEAAALKDAGGFRAVARSIVPEAYFAKRLTSGDRYSFMRAGTALSLLSAKGALDQRDTAVRMRYPQLHRRPENVFAATLTEYTFLLLPFAAAAAGFWETSIAMPAQVVAALACAMLVAAYATIAIRTRVNAWPVALLAFPLGVLLDLALLNRSMWQYEFGIVSWKGRNVTVPTMHVYPHLPELPQ